LLVKQSAREEVEAQPATLLRDPAVTNSEFSGLLEKFADNVLRDAAIQISLGDRPDVTVERFLPFVQ